MIWLVILFSVYGIRRINLLEQRHVEQRELGVLRDQRRRTRHNHVADLLVVVRPLVGLGPI